MSLILEILRRRSGGDRPYLQRFLYKPEGPAETAATALRRLNAAENLRDMDGAPAEPIRWESSCLQKRCGACAMLLNGRPGLACDARLSSYRKVLRLEPLKKFPVLADVVVDRSVRHENLKAMKVWFGSPEAEKTEAGVPETAAAMTERITETAYEASRCLQCGCCLEVCPNCLPGETFVGMAAAVPAARLIAELPEERRRELTALYRTRVYEGCGKSLSCQYVCPAEIPADELLARSNAAAVWRVLRKR